MANKSSEPPHPQGQPYNSLLKLLIEGQEQEILPQLWPGVEYVETKDIEVLRSPLRVDRVYLVNYRKLQHILHVEYEVSSDGEIVYRLAEYHTYFLRKYRLPVLSIIVYPFPMTVVESPLTEKSGREVLLTFRFRTLCLWKLRADTFVRKQIFCMYALLPAMQGASEQLLRQAIDELENVYRDLKKRFPQLLESARPDVEQIKSYDALGQLIVEISIAQDEAAALRAIEAHLH